MATVRSESERKQQRRVLILADSPYMGGINSHIDAIYSGFRGDEEIHLAIGCLPGRTSDEWLFDRLGPEVHRFKMNRSADASILGQIRKYVRDNEISLIHGHNYRSTLIAKAAATPARILASCHGVINPLSAYGAGSWLGLRLADHCVAVSQFVAGKMEQLGIPQAKVSLVYNGISVDVSHAADPPDRASPVVGFFGRLVEGKGLAVLLKAAESSPWHVLVVGDGPARSKLEAMSNPAKVRFVGAQTHTGPWYRIVDAVALPSVEAEAFPMTILEAAAHGKSIVASEVGGVPEFLSRENGILVPPGSVSHLRSALMSILDRSRREDLGRRAHDTWKKRFTRSHFVAAMRRVYLDCLASE